MEHPFKLTGQQKSMHTHTATGEGLSNTVLVLLFFHRDTNKTKSVVTILLSSFAFCVSPQTGRS